MKKHLGEDGIALFGHFEASPPTRGFDIEPYLVDGLDPDELYTLMHWHGWILAFGERRKVRELIARYIGDGDRRVCFRTRRYETETLGESIRRGIGYSVKQKRFDSESDDVIEHMGMIQKYLRGDKLRGSRISSNLDKVKTRLDDLWLQYRESIWTHFEELEKGGMRFATPIDIRDDYDSWKVEQLSTQREKLENLQENKHALVAAVDDEPNYDNFTTSQTSAFHYYNNWCTSEARENIERTKYFVCGTGFYRDRYLIIGFHPRGPP
jgi:hypothetical protein